MASFEKVNYTLRPAKSIERKMLCECFRRLTPFSEIESYRYVGFGSTYFSDFSLIHRSLGISNLISIEREEESSERFEFNLPFRSIDLQMGQSTDLLPELDWSPRTILWLDYDCKINADVLADVATFCRSCTSGSVLVVTVNSQPDSESDQCRLKSLTRRVGESKIPTDIDPSRLGGWGTAECSYRIIGAEIESTISHRNGVLPKDNKLDYRQLFNFHYRDSARMLTTGGVVYKQCELSETNACRFEQLDFVRNAGDAYEILVPNLTFKEMRHIEAQLPRGEGGIEIPLDEQDIVAYERVYRYFPIFVEAEL
ncbi:MAG: hypothetical protein OXG24_14290 [Gammaproteobacteria bacterium]|nr:hypothetical protein [Gammaproteobacteria bacterium]